MVREPVHVASPASYALGALRLVLGLTFLWAFLDKLLGLRYTTPPERAWLEGGNPTQGYLGSSFGPLEDMFHAMAGHPVVDALFMLGLLGVGLALTLGIGTRIGGWAGVAMVLLMYVSHPPPWAEPNGTNPVLDDHLLQAAALALVALTTSGDVLGLGRWWAARTAKWPWLR